MTELHVIDRSNNHQCFELMDESTSIGRSKDNHVVVEDTTVSRKHIKIIQKDETYFIQDLKSTNGTFINGELLHPFDQVEVEEGLPFVIGKVILTIGKAYEGDISQLIGAIESPKRAGKEIKSIDRSMTSKKNMELVYNVSKLLSKTSDLNEILETILNYIFDLLKRVDRGVIIVISSETGDTLDVITRFKESSEDTVMMYSRTVVEKVIKEGKAVMITDTFAQEEVDLSESLRLMRIGSVLCVPLISKNKVHGVIYIDSVEKPFGFRKEDLDLITAISTPAALSIENALLSSK